MRTEEVKQLNPNQKGHYYVQSLNENIINAIHNGVTSTINMLSDDIKIYVNPDIMLVIKKEAGTQELEAKNESSNR